MNCALCNEILDESLDSREHLILNAIGGRRKVRRVLCIRCNNTSGADWDSVLADQLNPLALLFDIDRQEGQVPARKFETSGGGQFWLNPDGTMNPAAMPYRKTPKDGGGWQIQISARTPADARKILKGVAEKHPEWTTSEYWLPLSGKRTIWMMHLKCLSASAANVPDALS